MQKLIYQLLVFSIILITISCSSSDNSTNNPPPSKTYFPMKEGNYWVYNSVETDPNTNQVTTSRDSSTITGKFEVLGRMAYKFQNFSDGQKTEDSHQYIENEQLYRLLLEIIPGGLFNIPGGQIENKWLLVANMNSSNLDGYEFSFPEVPFDFGGTQINISGKVKIEGKKGDKVVLSNIMGKELIAQKFTHNFIINAEGKLPNIPLPIKLTEIIIPYHTYYAEGIGLVKSETESADVSIAGAFNFKTPSSVSTLVNYKINN